MVITVNHLVLLDLTLIVKAATLILISGRGSAISSILKESSNAYSKQFATKAY